jgi:cobalamin biosynthesis Mg chelatase CobN
MKTFMMINMVVLIDSAKEVIKNTTIEDSKSCVVDESHTKDDNTQLSKHVIEDNKYESAEVSDISDSCDSTEGSNESDSGKSTERLNKSDTSDSKKSSRSESTKGSNDSDTSESTKGSNNSDDEKLEPSSEEEFDEDPPENILTGHKMLVSLKLKLNLRREMAKVKEKVPKTPYSENISVIVLVTCIVSTVYKFGTAAYTFIDEYDSNV